MKRFFIIMKYMLPVLLVAAMFTNAPYQWLTARAIDAALIKDKQIATESREKDGKVVSTYMIYTDHGVFRNDDAGWHLKYSSSDVYGALDVGKTYRLRVYGWRIPILSMYPNIISVDDPVIKAVPALPAAVTSK